MVAKKWTVEIFNNDVDNEEAVPLALELVENMRPQDLEDIKATGQDEGFMIIKCLRMSEETRIYRGEDGKLLCLLGKGFPSWSAPGRSIWMIGTNELYNGYAKELLFKEARNVLNDWKREHGILHNAVYEGNKKSIQYLTRLGAVFLPEVMISEGNRFYSFYMAYKGE